MALCCRAADLTRKQSRTVQAEWGNYNSRPVARRLGGDARPACPFLLVRLVLNLCKVVAALFIRFFGKQQRAVYWCQLYYFRFPSSGMF